MLRKNDYVVLVSLVTLFTFVTLFIFRALDDNRLTSWQWVFSAIDADRIFFILLPGIICSYFFSRSQFPEQNSAVFLFLISFVISSFFWREPELIVDASRYFTQAKHLEVYGSRYFFNEWGRDIAVWTDMPVVPFFYGLIFRFIGELRSYIQVFTTLLFSATVVLTYCTGKELWNKEVGFAGGALLLGMPYLFTQTPLMLVDVPVMFLLTLSIYTTIKAMKQGGILMIVFSSLAIFLTVFSKYSAWLMLSVLIVVVAVYISRRDSKQYIYRAFMLALLSLSLAAVVIWLKFDVISDQIGLLLSYQKPGLRRWGESFVSTFLFQIHPFITLSALYSLYAAYRKKDLKYVIISYLIVIVMLLQIKRIRYIIMVLPMLSLMSSYGLQEVRNIELKRFIVLCIVISSVIIALFAYLPFVQTISAVNLKEAGEYLDSINVSGVEVAAINPPDTEINQAVSVPLLDIFTHKNIYFTHDDKSSPPPEKIRESSLRFTWEYKNPGYYFESKEHKKSRALAVISNETDIPLPDFLVLKIKGYHKTKVFKTVDELFRHETIVTIYH